MSMTAIISAANHRRIRRARAWLEGQAPATEVLIVAATLDAANELARCATKEKKAAFGWHRLTLPQLAATIAAPALTTRGLIPLSQVGNEAVETEPWREGSETWRVLRAYFPGTIETHCLVQDFFFGADLMLRRHDYSVNIAGGFAAAQLTSAYVEASGIRLPSKRRAYARRSDRRPILEMLLVSIDISEVHFT